MSDSFEMRPIARIRSDFGSKFGVPRQSGLVDALEAAVVFEEPYRNPDALRDVLALDPRPRYQQDPDRVYGFLFAGQEVRFTVDGDRLQVVDIK